jgi:hypothetical protein
MNSKSCHRKWTIEADCLQSLTLHISSSHSPIQTVTSLGVIFRSFSKFFLLESKIKGPNLWVPLLVQLVLLVIWINGGEHAWAVNQWWWIPLTFWKWAYIVLVTNNGSPYQYCLHSKVEWTLPTVHKGLESKGLILLQQRKGSHMSYVGKKFHQCVHLPLRIIEYGKQKEKKSCDKLSCISKTNAK